MGYVLMFNFSAFLNDKFHSPHEVVRLLRSYNVKASLQEAAVAKWFQRGTVPGAWFAVLLSYLELEEGAPVRLAKYIKGTPS